MYFRNYSAIIFTHYPSGVGKNGLPAKTCSMAVKALMSFFLAVER